MIIIIIYTIISFLLDSLLSNYISPSITSMSIFNTIYTIIAIILIYNYFDNDKKYLKIIIPLSILFDIVYTNTFMINIILFIIIYIIFKQLNYYIPNNLFTINIKTILGIIIYNILSYIIILLFNVNNYPITILLTIIYKSIIMTIIYTSISYILLNKIYYKFYDKKIK